MRSGLTFLAMLLIATVAADADSFVTKKSKVKYDVTGMKPGRGLLFVFHGAGGNPGQARGSFARGGSPNNLMVVSTHNNNMDRGMTKLVEIIDDIASRTMIDWSRIHVAGLSAGANISVFAANQFPELICSIGTFQGGGAVRRPSGKDKLHMPYIFMSEGKADGNFPFAMMKRAAETSKANGCEVTFREHPGGHMPLCAKHISEWVKWLKNKRKRFDPGVTDELSWSKGSPDDLSFADDKDGLVLLYVYRSKKDKNSRALQNLEMVVFRNQELSERFSKFACVRVDMDTNKKWKEVLKFRTTSGLVLLHKDGDKVKIVKELKGRSASIRSVASALRLGLKRVKK